MVLADKQNQKYLREVSSIAKPLVAMLKHSKPATLAAAGALSRLNDEHLKNQAWQPSITERELMIALVNNPITDIWVIHFLALILGQKHDSPAVVPLLGWLNNPSPNVRQTVVETLGYIGDSQVVALMTQISRYAVR